MSASSESLTGEFARFLHGADGASARLQRGVELVVELVDGCDHAGVTVASKTGVWSAAATDDVVRDGDALQYALGEGPCLDTVRFEHTVLSHDLISDRRWPQWAARVVADFGVHAMMSLLLYTEEDTLGALNLYADQAEAWDADAIAIGHALADQLAVAVADAREIENRGRAMAGRTVIGQAQGILMERYRIDGERAFDYLRRISQDTNRKLVAIAEELVRTRQLPDGTPMSPRPTDDPPSDRGSH